ncbi:rubredoxin, partial [Vibrio parahaemolyticus]|nr:rubredoxin [Vibrio parahaemolyticus]
IHARLTDAGFETAVSLKTKWRPDGKAMRECREHGQNIAKLWAKHDLTSPVLAPAIAASAPQVQSQPAAPVTTQAAVDAAPSNPNTEAHPADCQCMVCTVCNWVYDPAKGEPNQGVEPGTAWSEVPDYFLCPECHLGKDVFVEYNG